MAGHRQESPGLRCGLSASSRYRSCWRLCCNGEQCKVLFDNCSHQSGKQRCYIACPSPHHAACFKYSMVHLFLDDAAAAAWLMAWANHARNKPAAFTKCRHAAFKPSEDAVAQWRAVVGQEPQGVL